MNTLTQLYNTLANIETKGENTIMMANALMILQRIINESVAVQNTSESEATNEAL